MEQEVWMEIRTVQGCRQGSSGGLYLLIYEVGFLDP